jgi:hypothetical protein
VIIIGAVIHGTLFVAGEKDHSFPYQLAQYFSPLPVNLLRKHR